VLLILQIPKASVKSIETSDNSTEVSGEINETFKVSLNILEVSFLVKFRGWSEFVVCKKNLLNDFYRGTISPSLKSLTFDISFQIFKVPFILCNMKEVICTRHTGGSNFLE
jgi:hypothetical protein